MARFSFRHRAAVATGKTWGDDWCRGLRTRRRSERLISEPTAPSRRRSDTRFSAAPSRGGRAGRRRARRGGSATTSSYRGRVRDCPMSCGATNAASPRSWSPGTPSRSRSASRVLRGARPARRSVSSRHCRSRLPPPCARRSSGTTRRAPAGVAGGRAGGSRRARPRAVGARSHGGAPGDNDVSAAARRLGRADRTRASRQRVVALVLTRRAGADDRAHPVGGRRLRRPLGQGCECESASP